MQNDRLVSAGSDQTIRIWNLKALATQKRLEPMLNLFISSDLEWVIWSKSGYYNASINGDDYIGWHINRGSDKEARFLTIDNIAGMKNKMVMDAILQYGSEEEALKALGLSRKNITLPPYIRIVGSHNIVSDAKKVAIQFDVEGEVEEFIITQNGARLKIEPTPTYKENRYKFTITPESNRDEIIIKAKTDEAIGEAIKVAIQTQTPRNFTKPKLSILSIGVSDYQNPQWNLNYADDDARAFVETLKQAGKTFGRIEHVTLIDSNATRDKILDGLEKIESFDVSTKDIVVIFLSGHGVNDKKKQYYFLGHDGSLKRLRSRGVEWDEFVETINYIQAKVFLIVDTCHSGNILGNSLDTELGDRDFSKAIDEIKAQHREVAILTASSANESSIEQKEWGHGALSKALLEGIANPHIQTVEELGLYVKARVQMLTNYKQTPQVYIPKSIKNIKVILQ